MTTAAAEWSWQSAFADSINRFTNAAIDIWVAKETPQPLAVPAVVPAQSQTTADLKKLAPLLLMGVLAIVAIKVLKKG